MYNFSFDDAEQYKYSLKKNKHPNFKSPIDAIADKNKNSEIETYR